MRPPKHGYPRLFNENSAGNFLHLAKFVLYLATTAPSGIAGYAAKYKAQTYPSRTPSR